MTDWGRQNPSWVRSISCVSFQTVLGYFASWLVTIVGKRNWTPLQHSGNLLTKTTPWSIQHCQFSGVNKKFTPIQTKTTRKRLKINVLHINTIPQELNLQEIEESVFQRLYSSKVRMVGNINPSFIWWTSNLDQIKSDKVYHRPQHIAGLKRPQERGNAVTALLVHSEGRIFRRRLVCN